MKRIIFNSHPIIKKWAVPNLYGSGDVFQKIRARSKLLRNCYKTPLVCLNPVAAFWIRTKYETSPNLKITRMPVIMSDGGTVGLDMLELPNPTSTDPSLPNIILCPGGNETTQSTKPQTLIRTYLQAGYPKVFVCNYRGKAGTPLTSPRYTFPFGEFNDLADVIEVLEERYKNERWLLVGNCFGGSSVVDYIASPHSDRDTVVGAVLHSIQWNLVKSNEVLLKEPSFSLFTKPYGTYLRDSLVNAKPGEEEVHKKVCEIIGEENIQLLKDNPLKTGKDMENLYIHGVGPLCNNAMTVYEHYFDNFSANRKFHRISKPLVVINSLDDITAPLSQVDIDEMLTNPNLCLWLFAAGGHCGYVKSLFPLTNYIDDVVVECSNIVCASN